MSTKYEEYADTNQDGSLPFSGDWWYSQTFTPDTDHTITSVKLYLKKGGTPTDNITVSIRNTDANGLPTGGDLCSGTYASSSLTTSFDWYEITLGDGTVCMASSVYAIVARIAKQTYPNIVYWGMDASSPSYTGGSLCGSFNAGLTWNTDTNYDFIFEEWGDAYTPGAVTVTVPVATATGQAQTPNLIAGVLINVPTATCTGAGCVPAIGVPIQVPVATATGMGLVPDAVRMLNHAILHGQYISRPTFKNRIYVLGMDNNGNLVSGEAVDSTEITDSGEKLLIHSESMITSQTDAEAIATIIKNKVRLNEDRGTITIPTNCGMEMWDVIRINDTTCNQTNADYRVAGWTFTYDTTQGIAGEHKVRLTTV